MGEPSSLMRSVDVLELNDELRSYVDRDWTARMKLEKLRKMIFSAEMLDLEYDTRRTRTAIETFQARRGNCLSMTNLFIAMARYAELDAKGNKALEEGNYKLAIRTLKSAIRLGNNEPEFYRLLHMAYDRTGNSKKSLENLLLANYYQKQKPPDLQQSTIRVISDPEADRFSRTPTIILAPR